MTNYSKWTLARTMITFLGFLILGLGYLWITHKHIAHDSFNTPACVSKDLQQQYNNYNAWWFNGKLTNAVVVIWGDAGGNVGLTQEMGNGTYFIQINPKYNTVLKQAAFTEFHEMAHLVCWNKDENSHGPCFQNEMKRLANQGAFNSLW